MIIESEQDWGPFETLFRAYQNYRVHITATMAKGRQVSGDARIDAAGRASVRVTLFRPEDDDSARPEIPTGKAVSIPYEDIERLLVY